MAGGGEPPELSSRLKAPSWLYLYFGYRKKTDSRGLEEEDPNVQNLLADSSSARRQYIQYDSEQVSKNC